MAGRPVCNPALAREWNIVWIGPSGETSRAAANAPESRSTPRLNARVVVSDTPGAATGDGTHRHEREGEADSL